MSIELEPSTSYPGRTDLIHKHRDESNMATRLALTPEDLATLRQALTKVKLTTVEELGEVTVEDPEPETKRETLADRERQRQLPMWRGDREYLQAQHELDWTPERYGGRK